MTHLLASAAMPLLRLIDPERAHRMALAGLRLGLAGRSSAPDDPILESSLLGRTLANPLGLAAGFDKDATAASGLLAMGFGAIELGTVTPRPQRGNPRPRMFRLEDGCVINRMGMNNQGIDAFAGRLARLNRTRSPFVMVAANVGINKEAADPERDYPALVAAVSPYVHYVALNVSSPNTAGLRALQDQDRLRAILAAVSCVTARPPVLVKVAPDLGPGALESIVEVVAECGIEGLIVSNTTLERPAELRGIHRDEAGGLSGPLLMAPSTALLARARRLAGGRLALVGCGGVTTGEDMLAKIQAGASLIQLYTAFAVHGPSIVARVKSELAAALRREGFATALEAVGTAVRG